MRLSVEITEAELRDLIVDHLRTKLGHVELEPRDVIIEVKPVRNCYDWGSGCFRARVEKSDA